MAYRHYTVDVGGRGRSYVENRAGKKQNAGERKLANKTLAAEEAEADEREADDRHGGGFGNLKLRIVGCDSAARARTLRAEVQDDGETVALPDCAFRGRSRRKGEVEPQARQVGGDEIDRKSTRLNSSHLGISYA